MTEWLPLLVLTFAGSAIGGLSRYALSGLVARRCGERFPLGTMIVNVTGAFLIGMMWSLPWEQWAGASRLAHDFVLFGFLGGYTTVSSFTLNTLMLLQDGEWRHASINLFASYFLCLGAVFAGAAIVGGWLSIHSNL